VWGTATMSRMSSAGRPSRKRIRKSAGLLRRWWLDPGASVNEEIAQAWGRISDFRSTFQRPLDKVTIQLRRFVEYESPEQIVVAQRLSPATALGGRPRVTGPKPTVRRPARLFGVTINSCGLFPEMNLASP